MRAVDVHLMDVLANTASIGTKSLRRSLLKNEKHCQTYDIPKMS
jgi:hypothetical protein